MMCGGHSNAKQPDDRTLSLVAQLNKAMCDHLKIEETELVLKSYTSQVVAGTNFTFTLAGHGHTYIVKVFQPLPHTGEPAQVTEGSLVE